MRWTGYVASREGERKSCIQGFLVKSEGKRTLGRPRHRWEKILRWLFRKWDVQGWTGSI